MKLTTTTTTATPPGAPAPAELSSPMSGAIKRQRKAAAAPPLSDVTNLLLLPDIPAPTKPRGTGRRPLPPPSDASSTCSSTASVTPAPKPSSAAVLEEGCSAFKSPAISTVYARRGATKAEGRRRNGTTNNGKEPAAAAGTASCPPLGKSTRNSNRKTSVAQDTRPISSSAPCHEAKKKRPSSSTPKLQEDFVKKQRAYFADIDAFELPEEYVSETDLE
ncbi:predicted GPI-anchored protein 58 [Phragmites australis]|uniref:predicted GPI-anchored protein 58 n=1 Tax=Phragmites australis TaxID=29695 RepID=UPI002D77C6A7|nr:predicted GPI-anchored protein 58 [Phragmites australis]